MVFYFSCVFGVYHTFWSGRKSLRQDADEAAALRIDNR